MILPLLAATLLLLAACGRDDNSSGGGGGSGSAAPGVTDTTIKLGSSYPFSGPASAYSAIPKALNGFFKKLNDNGGVNGRKVQFITYDDGYEPQRALANAKRLVEQDKVFAIVNPLGTANNLAMQDYLNQNKVPQLFVATGATVFGSGQAKFPYTTGWQPTYQTESKVYAEYLKTAKPNAKVAVLYQNDGFGKDLLGGFTEGIKGTGISIVAQESYEATDPTVAPQVKKLAASKADTFLDITTPKAGAQAIATVAQTGWKPLHILNSVAASKAQVLKPVGFQYAQGIVTASYFKALDDPRWANDPAVQGLPGRPEEVRAGRRPDRPVHRLRLAGRRDDRAGAAEDELADPGRDGRGGQAPRLHLRPDAAGDHGQDRRRERPVPDRGHADRAVHAVRTSC